MRMCPVSFFVKFFTSDSWNAPRNPCRKRHSRDAMATERSASSERRLLRQRFRMAILMRYPTVFPFQTNRSAEVAVMRAAERAGMAAASTARTMPKITAKRMAPGFHSPRSVPQNANPPPTSPNFCRGKPT